MYDPVYRSVMGAKTKNKKITNNEMKTKLMTSIIDISLYKVHILFEFLGNN